MDNKPAIDAEDVDIHLAGALMLTQCLRGEISLTRKYLHLLKPTEQQLTQMEEEAEQALCEIRLARQKLETMGNSKQPMGAEFYVLPMLASGLAAFLATFVSGLAFASPELGALIGLATGIAMLIGLIALECLKFMRED